jgi:hypothetical protein
VGSKDPPDGGAECGGSDLGRGADQHLIGQAMAEGEVPLHQADRQDHVAAEQPVGAEDPDHRELAGLADLGELHRDDAAKMPAMVIGQPGRDQHAAAGTAQRRHAAGTDAQVEHPAGGLRVDPLHADPGSAEGYVRGVQR